MISQLVCSYFAKFWYKVILLYKANFATFCAYETLQNTHLWKSHQDIYVNTTLTKHFVNILIPKYRVPTRGGFCKVLQVCATTNFRVLKWLLLIRLKFWKYHKFDKYQPNFSEWLEFHGNVSRLKHRTIFVRAHALLHEWEPFQNGILRCNLPETVAVVGHVRNVLLLLVSQVKKKNHTTDLQSK